jgi:DnaD/phage-associated family protein
MKYNINYGHKVAVIPGSVTETISRAGAIDLKVLISLCASGGSVDIKKLAKQFSCGEDDIKESLSFWRGAGIIEQSDCKEAPVEHADGDADSSREVKTVAVDKNIEVVSPAPKKLRGADELPKYTSEELSNILEERQETAALIDECQRIMGKVFNLKEINVLMGLVDYLEFDCEYIMMLLTYCVSLGKKTMHYAEKLAFALYDAGITTGEMLAEELRRREAANDAEGKIRSLFGVGERAFTTKEKKFISAWINDMGYSVDIIEKAYEVTADATGKGSFPYANSVLERWFASGLRTLSEIEDSYKKGGSDAPVNGSFDTDSFFEAAVKRSLGGN